MRWQKALEAEEATLYRAERSNREAITKKPINVTTHNRLPTTLSSLLRSASGSATAGGARGR